MLFDLAFSFFACSVSECFVFVPRRPQVSWRSHTSRKIQHLPETFVFAIVWLLQDYWPTGTVRAGEAFLVLASRVRTEHRRELDARLCKKT